MKLALGQTIGTPGDVAANLSLMKKLATEAAGLGADLLLLPELFLSGYHIGSAIPELAEAASGPASRAAGEIAAAAGIAVAYGYPERAPEGVYNAAQVIDRTGRSIARYRKAYLWGPAERAYFLPGMPAELFDFGGLRCGLMICYDLDFPEYSRALAAAGADAVLALSATSVPYQVVPRYVIPARAYENRMFVAFANRAGAENGLHYVAESCIAAPDGSFIARCGTGEELCIGTLDTLAYATFRRNHSIESDRRTDL